MLQNTDDSQCERVARGYGEKKINLYHQHRTCGLVLALDERSTRIPYGREGERESLWRRCDKMERIVVEWSRYEEARIG